MKSLKVYIFVVAALLRGSLPALAQFDSGSDGSDGTAQIKRKGGMVAVEHESTCAIYGMPRCVVEKGNADKVLPLPEMAAEIVRMCTA